MESTEITKYGSSKIAPPVFDPCDDLSAPLEFDYEAVIAPLVSQRTDSPIIRESNARDVGALFQQSIPRIGSRLTDLLDEIAGAVERYPRRNTHPGFFGWIAPSGVATDPLAHAIVAAINQNVGGHWSSPVGAAVERIVVRWLSELVSFPEPSEGLLLSGGSLANMAGIATALVHHFGDDYRTKGLLSSSQSAQPVIICSRAAHFSVRRAAAMLGIGTENVVAVATDRHFCMRADKLADALDSNAGVVCVVASAGTTNTGAIDPLDDISRLCKQFGVWLHVDAAYGGGALLSSELKPRLKGIEKADSVIMDMHKWFFQSLDGSVLLYRDPATARKMFYEKSDYLDFPMDGPAEQKMIFHLGPELSRRFRALPFYLAFRHYGIDRMGRNVLHNVQCAKYLADLVEREPELELISAPQLSILCFRFLAHGLGEQKIDAINSAIRDQIQSEGDYLISATRVHNRPVLRVCIVNHATRALHVEGLLESVLRIGRSML